MTHAPPRLPPIPWVTAPLTLRRAQLFSELSLCPSGAFTQVYSERINHEHVICTWAPGCATPLAPTRLTAEQSATMLEPELMAVSLTIRRFQVSLPTHPRNRLRPATETRERGRGREWLEIFCTTVLDDGRGDC